MAWRFKCEAGNQATISQKKNNLTIAVCAADEHVGDNRGPKQRRELKEDDENRGAANSGSDEAGREGIAEEEGRILEAIKDEIRGIPDEADLSEDQGNQWDNEREDQQSTTAPTAQEKGKGKEL